MCAVLSPKRFPLPVLRSSPSSFYANSSMAGSRLLVTSCDYNYGDPVVSVLSASGMQGPYACVANNDDGDCTGDSLLAFKTSVTLKADTWYYFSGGWNWVEAEGTADVVDTVGAPVGVLLLGEETGLALKEGQALHCTPLASATPSTLLCTFYPPRQWLHTIPTMAGPRSSSACRRWRDRRRHRK